MSSESTTLIAVILTTAMVLPAMREQIRTDPAGVRKTLKLAGAYLLFCGVGLAFVLWRINADPHTNGLAVLVFLVAWIFFGVLWLTRLVPRYRELPAWFDRRFSVIDWILLAAIAAGAWGCLA